MAKKKTPPPPPEPPRPSPPGYTVDHYALAGQVMDLDLTRQRTVVALRRCADDLMLLASEMEKDSLDATTSFGCDIGSVGRALNEAHAVCAQNTILRNLLGVDVPSKLEQHPKILELRQTLPKH